ncbi:hypothetical protein HMI54_004944 [Coelomomyces lativittatus]|nr:hypothetical protein HMI54_004944 [Coelomomyces lativittatus]
MDLWALKNTGSWEGDDTEHLSKQRKEYTTTITTTITTCSSSFPKSTSSSFKIKETFQKEGSIQTTKSNNGNPFCASTSTSSEWLRLFKEHGDQDNNTEQASLGSFIQKPSPPQCQNSPPSHPSHIFQPFPPDSTDLDNVPALSIESKIGSLCNMDDPSNHSTFHFLHSETHGLPTNMDTSFIDQKTAIGIHKTKMDILQPTSTASHEIHDDVHLLQKTDFNEGPRSSEKDISTSFSSSSNQHNKPSKSLALKVTKPLFSAETIPPSPKKSSLKQDQKRAGVVRYSLEELLRVKDLFISQNHSFSVLQSSLNKIQRPPGSAYSSNYSHGSMDVSALDHFNSVTGSGGMGVYPNKHYRNSRPSHSNVVYPHGHSHPSRVGGGVPHSSASFSGRSFHSNLHGTTMHGSTQLQHPSTHPLYPLSKSNPQSSNSEWLTLFKKHVGDQDNQKEKTSILSYGLKTKSLRCQNSTPSHSPNIFQPHPFGMHDHPPSRSNQNDLHYFVDATFSHRSSGGPEFLHPSMPMTTTKTSVNSTTSTNASSISASSKNQLKKVVGNKNRNTPASFNMFSVLNGGGSSSSESLDSIEPEVKEKSKPTSEKSKSPVEKRTKSASSTSPVSTSSSSSTNAASKKPTTPSTSPLPTTATVESPSLSETKVMETVENALKDFIKDKDAGLILKKFQQLPPTEEVQSRVILSVIEYITNLKMEEGFLYGKMMALLFQHGVWTPELFKTVLLEDSFLDLVEELKIDAPPFPKLANMILDQCASVLKDHVLLQLKNKLVKNIEKWK